MQLISGRDRTVQHNDLLPVGKADLNAGLVVSGNVPEQGFQGGSLTPYVHRCAPVGINQEHHRISVRHIKGPLSLKAERLGGKGRCEQAERNGKEDSHADDLNTGAAA